MGLHCSRLYDGTQKCADCWQMGATMFQWGIVGTLQDTSYQPGMILSQGLEHVKSDNSDWWKLGKGLQTGTQMTVIWMTSFTFTMQMQGLTKSVLLCVIWFHGSNCECTVLQVISAVPPMSCSQGEAFRTGWKCHHAT